MTPYELTTVMQQQAYELQWKCVVVTQDSELACSLQTLFETTKVDVRCPVGYSTQIPSLPEHLSLIWDLKSLKSISHDAILNVHAQLASPAENTIVILPSYSNQPVPTFPKEVVYYRCQDVSLAIATMLVRVCCGLFMTWHHSYRKLYNQNKLAVINVPEFTNHEANDANKQRPVTDSSTKILGESRSTCRLDSQLQDAYTLLNHLIIPVRYVQDAEKSSVSHSTISSTRKKRKQSSKILESNSLYIDSGSVL